MKALRCNRACKCAHCNGDIKTMSQRDFHSAVSAALGYTPRADATLKCPRAMAFVNDCCTRAACINKAAASVYAE